LNPQPVNTLNSCLLGAAALSLFSFSPPPAMAAGVDAVPRFSVSNMDRSVEPGTDFYHFAAGAWLKNNPVPADKSRWSGFEELQERNWHLLREILETRSHPKAPRDAVRRQVGDFYASAMDTNRLEQLRFQPIARDLKRIAGL